MIIFKIIPEIELYSIIHSTKANVVLSSDMLLNFDLLKLI